MSGWDLVQLYAIYCPTSAHIFGGMVERGRQKTMSRRGGAQHTFEYIYISIYVVHAGAKALWGIFLFARREDSKCSKW